MSNFVLDYSKKQTLQISNDAFCFLYYGEEPLDEDNLEEANEVSEMFSNNFYIEDDWKVVDDSDLIECTFVPYVEDQADYDEYEDLTKYIQQQIKWLDANHIRVWWFNWDERITWRLRFIPINMALSVFIQAIKMRIL